MRLVNANELFNKVADDKELEGSEKIKVLKMISEQPTEISIVELMTQVGGLDVVGINGEPFVSFKDVLRIINGGLQHDRD